MHVPDGFIDARPRRVLQASNELLEQINPHHKGILDTINHGNPYLADSSDDGEWVYNGNEGSSYWGTIWVECYHSDNKGTIWTAY